MSETKSLLNTILVGNYKINNMLNNSALNVYIKRLFSTHLAKYCSIKFLYAINLIEIEVFFYCFNLNHRIPTCMWSANLVIIQFMKIIFNDLERSFFSH